MQLSPAQLRIMAIEEHINLFMGGGRGGAKSYAALFLMLRHELHYGPKCRILLVRKSFPSLKDIEHASRDMFFYFWGRQARYNKSEHIWYMPHGGTIEFGQLDGQEDYDRYQGRSFSMLLVDEAGQFPLPDYIDMLRSNLRGAADVPLRTVIIANPGGVGHAWLRSRYAKYEPWEHFEVEPEIPESIKAEVGHVDPEEWVNVHLTFRDNPFIDQKQYVTNLAASAPGDPELLEAWLAGSWDILRGAYFGDLIRKAKCETLTPEELWNIYRAHKDRQHFGQHLFIAHDWGSSAPSSTGVLLESVGFADPRGRWWPRGSFLLLDEFASYVPRRLHQGTGETPEQLSVHIKALCEKWRIAPNGVADDACFAKAHGFQNPSIAQQFQGAGVNFVPAKKGSRITGWQLFRELMSNAQDPEKPGFVADPRCRYFWDTVPALARDPRNPEDIAKGQPDHAADMARYGVTWPGVMRAESGYTPGHH